MPRGLLKLLTSNGISHMNQGSMEWRSQFPLQQPTRTRARKQFPSVFFLSSTSNHGFAQTKPISSILTRNCALSAQLLGAQFATTILPAINAIRVTILIQEASFVNYAIWITVTLLWRWARVMFVNVSSSLKILLSHILDVISFSFYLPLTLFFLYKN